MLSVADGINRTGGRRFFLTLCSSLINTLLLMNGYIDQTIYRDLIIATVAAYITGNVWQKHIEAKSASA